MLWRQCHVSKTTLPSMYHQILILAVKPSEARLVELALLYIMQYCPREPPFTCPRPSRVISDVMDTNMTPGLVWETSFWNRRRGHVHISSNSTRDPLWLAISNSIRTAHLNLIGRGMYRRAYASVPFRKLYRQQHLCREISHRYDMTVDCGPDRGRNLLSYVRPIDLFRLFLD